MTTYNQCEDLDQDYLDCLDNLEPCPEENTDDCFDMYESCEGEYDAYANAFCNGLAQINYNNCVTEAKDMAWKECDEIHAECDELLNAAEECWGDAHHPSES